MCSERKSRARSADTQATPVRGTAAAILHAVNTIATAIGLDD